MKPLFHFWGKARPATEEGSQWHPLAYHCLDVAAVTDALLTCDRGLCDHLARLFRLSPTEVLQVARFLVCLHDVGKFAKRFQAKAPHLYGNSFDGDPAVVPAYYDHGAGGLHFFDAFSDRFTLPTSVSHRVWRTLISAVTGHHGAPPAPVEGGSAMLRRDYGKGGIEAVCDFIEDTHVLFGPLPAPQLDGQTVGRASFALAGVAVVADWIGSNQRWFPYREPRESLTDYWADAQEIAAKAVAVAGVLPARFAGSLDYASLIGPAAIPSPMQEWARCAELPSGPALFMIEDETGSGKTEAAMMLAHRLMVAGNAAGLYFALPTMATANAMFDRLEAAHRGLFAETPSVALVHGARSLHEGFRSAVLLGGRDEASYEDDVESGETASAACAAWIADDRRRAFLADAGAGTVDQALMAILPARHQSIRLLGLMRRVLILDEVHAYDAYMQREIETLLEFQAGLGGSAIVMSATLPQVFRTRFGEAFARGLGHGLGEMAEDNNAYPLVTTIAADRHSAVPIAGQPGRARELPVRFLGTVEEALDALARAAKRGSAALYVRNTVDDAFEAYVALSERGLDAHLFHARFALVDRLANEQDVVRTFGKQSTPRQRWGKILVATQVVEQSLDLDFDILVTDLAPIDLIVQRAGRLWRHRERQRDGFPELLIVGPEPNADAPETWFSDAFPRAAHVYRNHAVLWLTASVLREAGCIRSPGDLRALIESVYGEGAEARLPDALAASSLDAEGRAGADRGIANTNVLRLARGYLRDSGAWDTDVRTPTRLVDDPQVTLRLGRLDPGGELAPYAGSEVTGERWRAWRLSEVNVSERHVSGEDVQPEHEAAAVAAKVDWTGFDRDKILVVLKEAEPDGSTWVGSALSGAAPSGSVTLTYDSRQGLRRQGTARD